MATPDRAALPLIQAGYFDTFADASYNLDTNITRRQRAFDYLMRDLGLRRRGNRFVADRRASADPYNAFRENERGAMANAANRGFGGIGVMERVAAAPGRNEIFKQAQRAWLDKQFENQVDRDQLRTILSRARRDAARWGVENEAFLPPKRRG